MNLELLNNLYIHVERRFMFYLFFRPLLLVVVAVVVLPLVVVMANTTDEDDRQVQVYLASFPPGNRFKPLDEELVYHYLLKKVNDEKLPPNKMRDVNIYDYNPEYLADKFKAYGESEGEWYFFTCRNKKYPKGSRPNRTVGDGFWKATGIDKKITREDTKDLIGLKKSLVFYRGKAPNGEKTNWIMHEYRVAPAQEKTPTRLGASAEPLNMQLDKWVLCRIYNKSDGVRVPYHHRRGVGGSFDNGTIEEDVDQDDFDDQNLLPSIDEKEEFNDHHQRSNAMTDFFSQSHFDPHMHPLTTNTLPFPSQYSHNHFTHPFTSQYSNSHLNTRPCYVLPQPNNFNQSLFSQQHMTMPPYAYMTGEVPLAPENDCLLFPIEERSFGRSFPSSV